jgi:hypothetical protein
MWCRGMLLWRVLIDGTEFKERTGWPVDNEYEMTVLRSTPDFASMVSKVCLEHLILKHPSEKTLAFEIYKILQAILDQNPKPRPLSSTLLGQLEELSRDWYVNLIGCYKSHLLLVQTAMTTAKIRPYSFNFLFLEKSGPHKFRLLKS